jgi:hypothetical protein
MALGTGVRKMLDDASLSHLIRALGGAVGRSPLQDVQDHLQRFDAMAAGQLPLPSHLIRALGGDVLGWARDRREVSLRVEVGPDPTDPTEPDAWKSVPGVRPAYMDVLGKSSAQVAQLKYATACLDKVPTSPLTARGRDLFFRAMNNMCHALDVSGGGLSVHVESEKAHGFADHPMVRTVLLDAGAALVALLQEEVLPEHYAVQVRQARVMVDAVLEAGGGQS